MSDANGPQADTTTAEERKPPTLADIVHEKTDDGRRIIEFFLDVMEDRIDGAELCHRIDAAKQLEKHRSKAAPRFLAKYRGVPCGHSTRGRPGSADPCSAPVATGEVSAPGPFTQDFLTVLSAVDEDLMARLVRAQTADGSTVIEFLDDVMQDRNDGFKCHHRIAAAKELIVHIVRDEAHESVPGEKPASVHPEPGSPEPVERVEGPVQSTVEGLAEGSEPGSPEPVERAEGPVQSTVEGSQPETTNSKPETLPVPRPRRRRTRTQRRREGAARAAMLGKHPTSERNKKEQQDKPAPVELTPAERRIRERLEQHWHEPDPYGAPIDSTHPGRSPPW